jgi:UDP-N-acetylglucosamine--N-acetylmuramyl-(pentapeptide) pyrophosphoryl-undecaprenol N-acetylglucosamine transferase
MEGRALMTSAARSLHWVIAGGGTGGHVTPALALAEHIQARGDEVLLMGSDQGIETRLVPEAGFELLALPARPVFGRSLAARVRIAPIFLKACWSAWRALGSFGADFVISTGGYASAPAVIAAALRRVPIALIEPNAIPGIANRAAARVATRVFVQFERAASILAQAGAAGRICNLGIPLRKRLIEAFQQAGSRRSPKAPFRLLVFGGSRGAHQINQAMMEAAAKLDASVLEIFHQTGEADREQTEASYRAAGLTAEVVAFESDMPARYRWADLALCRSGALTIAELALAGLPALLVPYPFAADDHQAANAAALVQAGAAELLDNRPLSGDRIVSALHDFWNSPERLTRMSESAAKLARPDATAQIIDDCLNRIRR